MDGGGSNQFTVAINFKLAALNWEKHRDMVMILKIFATQKR